jgi:hypothetical protein
VNSSVPGGATVTFTFWGGDGVLEAGRAFCAGPFFRVLDRGDMNPTHGSDDFPMALLSGSVLFGVRFISSHFITGIYSAKGPTSCW